MRARRTAAALATAFIAALVPVAPALAATSPSPSPTATATTSQLPVGFRQAAAGLAQHPVYVAPDSGAEITQDQVNSLDAEILKYNIPVFIAVLPDAANRVGVNNTPRAVGTALGRPGVYAVVAGHHFRAGSNGTLAPGESGALATSAFQAHNPGSNNGQIYPMLADFVKRVDYQLNPADKPKSHTGEVVGIVLGVIVLVILGVILGLVLLSRKRRREDAEREAAYEAAAFNTAKRDAQAQADRVQDALNSVATDDKKASAKHDEATKALLRAQDLLATAKTVDDVKPAQAELKNAEVAANDAAAYADGRDPDAERKAEAVAEARRQEALAKERAKEDARREKERAAAAAEAAANREKAKNISPDNYSPRQTRSSRYSNYYEGGYYGGVYYGPGYYADPFWTWVEMDMIANAFDNDREVVYEDAGSSSGNGGDWGGSSDSGSTDWGGSSNDSGGGDWGGGGGGGFDFGGGSSDSGGGGDWGGGGGDFGGGGGDSGGGSW